MKSAELLNLILLILLAACVRENHLKRIWHSAHEILPVSDALSVSVNIRQDSISTNSPISRAPTTLSPPTRLCIAKSPLPRPWPATYCLHSEEDTPDLLRPNGNVTFTCEYEHIGELSTDVASWIGRFTRSGGLLNHWSLEDCELYNVTRAFDEEVAASERDEKLLSPANRFNRIAPPVPQYIHPIESAPLCTRAFLLTHMRLTNFFTNMNLVAPCPRARPIEYIWIYNVSLANKYSTSILYSYISSK